MASRLLLLVLASAAVLALASAVDPPSGGLNAVLAGEHVAADAKQPQQAGQQVPSAQAGDSQPQAGSAAPSEPQQQAAQPTEQPQQQAAHTQGGFQGGSFADVLFNNTGGGYYPRNDYFFTDHPSDAYYPRHKEGKSSKGKSSKGKSSKGKKQRREYYEDDEDDYYTRGRKEERPSKYYEKEGERYRPKKPYYETEEERAAREVEEEYANRLKAAAEEAERLERLERIRQTLLTAEEQKAIEEYYKSKYATHEEEEEEKKEREREAIEEYYRRKYEEEYYKKKHEDEKEAFYKEKEEYYKEREEYYRKKYEEEKEKEEYYKDAYEEKEKEAFYKEREEYYKKKYEEEKEEKQAYKEKDESYKKKYEEEKEDKQAYKEKEESYKKKYEEEKDKSESKYPSKAPKKEEYYKGEYDGYTRDNDYYHKGEDYNKGYYNYEEEDESYYGYGHYPEDEEHFADHGGRWNYSLPEGDELAEEVAYPSVPLELVSKFYADHIDDAVCLRNKASTHAVTGDPLKPDTITVELTCCEKSASKKRHLQKLGVPDSLALDELSVANCEWKFTYFDLSLSSKSSYAVGLANVSCSFNSAARFCGDLPKELVLSGEGLVFAVPSKIKDPNATEPERPEHPDYHGMYGPFRSVGSGFHRTPVLPPRAEAEVRIAGEEPYKYPSGGYESKKEAYHTKGKKDAHKKKETHDKKDKKDPYKPDGDKKAGEYDGYSKGEGYKKSPYYGNYGYYGYGYAPHKPVGPVVLGTSLVAKVPLGKPGPHGVKMVGLVEYVVNFYNDEGLLLPTTAPLPPYTTTTDPHKSLKLVEPGKFWLLLEKEDYY